MAWGPCVPGGLEGGAPASRHPRLPLRRPAAVCSAAVRGRAAEWAQEERLSFPSTYTSKMRASHLIFTFRSPLQGAGACSRPQLPSPSQIPLFPCPVPAVGAAPVLPWPRPWGPVWGSRLPLLLGTGALGGGRRLWCLFLGPCHQQLLEKGRSFAWGTLWWLVGAVHQQELFPAGVLVLVFPRGDVRLLAERSAHTESSL